MSLTRTAIVPSGPPRHGDDTFLARFAVPLLYGQVLGLVACTFVLGHAGVGPVRFAFIGGCLAIGYQAWRLGPAKHLELSIILFVVAPFLRRVVDYSAGFQPSGYMLVGPLLALLPPCIDLYKWFVTGRDGVDSRLLAPYGLLGVCTLYAATLSIFNGQIVGMLVDTTKAVLPILYGIWLAARGGEQPDPVDAAARGFMIIMPLAGLYAIYQYFYLPDWDSYWMQMTATFNTSQGQAEVGKVRVFATMNSAESFGHFAAAGLLLLGFISRSRLAFPLCLPIVAGLMLSLYRTAWVELLVALVFCGIYSTTRARTVGFVICGVLGAVALLTTTSFGDVVLARMSTLQSAPSDDGSGKARMQEYVELYNHSDQLWLGLGMSGPASNNSGVSGSVPTPKLVEGIDGTIVVEILTMGIIGTPIYLVGIFWATGQGLVRVARAPEKRRVIAGAIVIGNFVVLTLASVTTGEIGFLFWSFLGIATSRMHRPDPAWQESWSSRLS